MKSKMFSFVTETWNPIAMHCPHDCYFGGCWAEALKRGRLKNTAKYKDLSEPKLIEKELHLNQHNHWKKGDYVFVEDMGDLFAFNVPDEFINQVLLTIWDNPDAKFLLLTKNPKRMVAWQKHIPENCLCGCTIETTMPLKAISKAPATCNRYKAMKKLDHPHKMICIEPIINFNSVQFLAWIEEIKPELVVIGYDNYHCSLPEPSLAKTQKFIAALRYEHFNVQTKTLREKES
jgi:protein gp37